ncbi:MAG: F0F1 ATP synthase subunit B [Nitrosomonas sp.]|nr:F0F1 ATP synthase subunit B [Nitrosomonas sp.]
MDIDWITVSAQIINFLILVWLLKRFLYQPIISAMDQREQRIAEQIGEAEIRERKADEAAAQYHEKARMLELQRDEIMAETHRHAVQQKKQLLDEAREEVDEVREHWHRQVQLEKAEFLDDLRCQMSNVLQKIARNALTDLADEVLEERIIQAFLNQLTALDDESRQRLLHAADTSEPVRVISTFTLDTSTRRHITQMIHTHLKEGMVVEYDESPEWLCGVVLNVGEHQLGWNLAKYLEQLNEQFEQVLVTTATVSPSTSAKKLFSNDLHTKG